MNVEEADKVSVVLRCEGHFTLNSIELVNEKSPQEGISKKDSEIEILQLDPSMIEEMNNVSFCEALHQAQMRISWFKLNVIDILKFPIGALYALVHGANCVGILSSAYDEIVLNLARANGIDVSKIKFYSSFVTNSMLRNWNVLIINPISNNGTMINGILEDITHLRYVSFFCCKHLLCSALMIVLVSY